MKKKISKKLVLGKETLEKLDSREISQIDGGISGSICGNPTCWQECRGSALCTF